MIKSACPKVGPGWDINKFFTTRWRSFMQTLYITNELDQFVVFSESKRLSTCFFSRFVIKVILQHDLHSWFLNKCTKRRARTFSFASSLVRVSAGISQWLILIFEFAEGRSWMVCIFFSSCQMFMILSGLWQNRTWVERVFFISAVVSSYRLMTYIGFGSLILTKTALLMDSAYKTKSRNELDSWKWSNISLLV